MSCSWDSVWTKFFFSKSQHLHFQNDTSAQRQIPEYIWWSLNVSVSLSKSCNQMQMLSHADDIRGGFSSFSFLQMANLAHRAGQLLQKQYLIIHPTADGNRHMFYFYFSILQWVKHKLFNCNQTLMCLFFYLLHYHRKGSLPAHSQIYQSFNQWKGQLHSTGEQLVSYNL